MKKSLARDTLKALHFAIDRGVIADDRLIQINQVIIAGVEEYCEEYDIDLEEIDYSRKENKDEN